MSGGVAILIGLVFVGLHVSEPSSTVRDDHARHATLALGVILLGIGGAMVGFSRVVEICHDAGAATFRRGWMVAGRYPLIWPHEYDAVEVRQRVPRFGGYLGMTSTIVWSVMLVNSKSSAAAEVNGFQSQAPAEALMQRLIAEIPDA